MCTSRVRATSLPGDYLRVVPVRRHPAPLVLGADAHRVHLSGDVDLAAIHAAVADPLLRR
jgi:hypothetical protein